MSTTSLYAKATGRAKDPEINEAQLMEREMDDQDLQNWLKFNKTTELLTFLADKEEEYKARAVKLASTGRDFKWINKCLIKAEALKEIIEYARNRRKPTDEIPGE
jgi:hypothetical protein